MIKKIIFILFLKTFLFSGCALIIEGKTQKIPLQITPSGPQDIIVNGKKVNDFDGTVFLDKSHKNNFVTIKKENYGEKTITFNRELWAPWFAANLIWLPAYPVAIFFDIFSSSAYTLTPEEAYVVMRKNEEQLHE